jgi:hypothetical protein
MQIKTKQNVVLGRNLGTPGCRLNKRRRPKEQSGESPLEAA